MHYTLSVTYVKSYYELTEKYMAKTGKNISRSETNEVGEKEGTGFMPNHMRTGTAAPVLIEIR